MASISEKNPDLIPRIIVAVIGIPVLLGAAFFGPNWLLSTLLTIAASIGAWEYLRMTLQNDFRVDGWLGVVAVAAMLTIAFWSPTPAVIGVAVVAITLGVFCAVLFSLKSIEESAKRLGAIFSGIFYVGVLFGAYALLIREGNPTETGATQAGWFLLPMFIVWAGDTGAYFVGRAIGKHKLAPLVSPGKSWEGAVGGLFFSALGAFIASWILPLPPLSPTTLVVLAIPGAILGQIGDLCESMIKRATGYKDSSRILYGHGGMLDRVDALIFAVPWVLIVRELWIVL